MQQSNLSNHTGNQTRQTINNQFKITTTKRTILLLMFALTSFNWIIGQISCYPDNANYNTGSTDGTNFTQTSLIYTESNRAERGWARFNTSAIPDGDEILAIELHLYVNDDNWAWFKVMSMESDPLGGDAASIFQDAGDGTTYATNISDFPEPGWYIVDLGITAAVDLKNLLVNDWFAIGLNEHETDRPGFYLSCDGWDETNKPYIVVTRNAPPSCPAPSALTVSNIAANSADLSWTENGTATNWNIKWGTSGFNPDTEGTIISSVTNPYTLSGLAADATFDWYVRSDCGGGDKSDWVGPKTFTIRDLAPAPYTQGFPTTSPPEGWTTTGWTIGTTSAIPALDGNYIRELMQSSTPRTFTTINIGNVSADMLLSFYYAHANYSYPYVAPGNGSGNFIVSISTDYGQSYTNLETVNNNSIASWQYKSYDLNAYAGEIVKIKITGNTNSGYYWLAFDSFSVDVPVSCPAPTLLSNSSVTPNSAELSWTERGSATSWNIKWATASFDPDTEGTLVSGVTNPFTLSGLDQNTNYHWYVQADCGGGSVSDWEGPNSFTTLHLSPAPYTQGFPTTSPPEGWTTTGWTIGTTSAIPALDGNYIRELM
ncbi:MAG: fibronectin type III domain-containing protein, partial [Bacteroidales bacterium]|nr:fibronectin type III domain-containing protein [Bacteroidales bacterium]